jgi:UDP-N-acetyl-D-galactosamine dehydrogenase
MSIQAETMAAVSLPDLEKAMVAVIGLGYVGLPLAVEFGVTRKVVGFDVSRDRIGELLGGSDRTREITGEELSAARFLDFTATADDLSACDVFIVTVPTPIDEHNQPDLGPLLAASKSVGSVMKRGSVVVFESTVYPGCTEEECVPVLEQASGLRFNKDFFVGYSPERINPGDRQHRLSSICKVTSGSTPEAAEFIDRLYAEIITAGTFKAESIRVAEAAKIIENTQRDINIALVNELAMIFNRMGIDTGAVLEAAGTKWNFLPFRPGLVGGHCIGVDPYYLTHKAQAVGHYPEIILAGRRLNDRMGSYVVEQLVKEMIARRIPVADARVLVLGATFKENCPDMRNSRVTDVVAELQSFGCDVTLYEPWADPADVERETGITPSADLAEGAFDAVVLAVAHECFRDMGAGRIRRLGKPNAHVLYDLKSVLPRSECDLRL